MKIGSVVGVVILLMSLTGLACGLSAPAAPTPRVALEVSAEPSVEPALETPAAPTPQVAAEVSAEPSVEPAVETLAATQTSIPAVPPTPTTAKIQLEIVQSQAWTDRDGNVRVNVLMRNPYDFPVAPTFRASADLLNKAGKFIRAGGLYFLDGISGGHGFILPGETIAANACFTCEQAPLNEAWDSVNYENAIADASGKWNYYTDVQAALSSVTFDGDSPIFWAAGTVKNNTDSTLSRISARVFVYDKDGNLVGAAEVSAWDVAPGATVNFRGYGIGKSPGGAVKTEVTAMGVKY